MPENVEELSACEEELAFEDIIAIKTHVGHGWRDVARRLSYSDGQIEQFEENYKHRGIDEVSVRIPRLKLNIVFIRFDKEIFRKSPGMYINDFAKS